MKFHQEHIGKIWKAGEFKLQRWNIDEGPGWSQFGIGTWLLIAKSLGLMDVDGGVHYLHLMNWDSGWFQVQMPWTWFLFPSVLSQKLPLCLSIEAPSPNESCPMLFPAIKIYQFIPWMVDIYIYIHISILDGDCQTYSNIVAYIL